MKIRNIPVLLALVCWLTVPTVWAQCSVGDMKGDFATQPQGILTAGPFAGPFAATGVIHFDGAGRFTGVASSSFIGTVTFLFFPELKYGETSSCFVTLMET